MPILLIEYAAPPKSLAIVSTTGREVRAGVTELGGPADLARFALGRLTGRELTDEDFAAVLASVRKGPRPNPPPPPVRRGPVGNLLAKRG